MKRKSHDDDMEDLRRRKDGIRRRIQAAKERRRFVDGVPFDSDANASEVETVWMVRNYEIKPDRRTRELQKIAKQVEAELEAEYEAEDDSDSDDPNIHPDFINGRDSDSDEEIEEDSAKDDDDEFDNSDKSDDSDD
ncbi:calsequestrin-1-like [Papaver somniferum]|uniref:calsequestrin-1-like n=1 Tax=Papaver somniferum TaxID=3469 RepID=UPI000E6F5D3C|nr:calsequestrin-1-like [Papaver somniferum]